MAEPFAGNSASFDIAPATLRPIAFFMNASFLKPFPKRTEPLPRILDELAKYQIGLSWRSVRMVGVTDGIGC